MKRTFFIAIGGILAAVTGVAVTIGMKRRRAARRASAPSWQPEEYGTHATAAGGYQSTGGTEPVFDTAAGIPVVAGYEEATESGYEGATDAGLEGMAEPAVANTRSLSETTAVRKGPEEIKQRAPETITHEHHDVDLSSIPLGTRVLDADGRELGAFRNVHGGYFELDRPTEADFWLSRVHISEASGGAVRLDVAEAELDLHRLHAPGLEPEDEPLDRPHDQVISDEEALEQRERMERQLREQRGVIDTDIETPLPAQEPHARAS